MLTQADVHWIELDSVDSTNDYLSRAYQQGRVSGCAVVLTQAQTAGRGRAGRSWKAVPGASLCFSLGLPVAGYQLPFLPLCVGLAVAEVLERFEVPVQLKWPNDLIVGGQKLGGVLCESFHTGSGATTVIGVGLNVHPVDVPQALSGAGASCLVQWVDASILPSLRELAEACVLSILHQVEAARAQGISALFKQFALRDAWLGLEVVVLEEGKALFSGRAMGIDENGAYLISTSNGLRSVIAGDLSLRVAA
ncbi:BirA family biotin operon repressor/biotin-[acetyl-CoA-carboxylase] ligase [Limnobacter thiooxidans]|uniref:biotin--[biotin carboxyl-carrier protein] ligase n=1 Tax=Limnobacter thiooxidans TaxID=131080 RepID=A0AA86JHS6_9BURK|nr:BirA family biotin operon repressor/biotin-[acetyl-CoA-carboxylase] ligase [Limnobacter thiooxidans]BET27366.1 biotin--[acetyl-CoA-carboxylase] ligase [Limnobacter thiooxidans]